MIYTKNNRYELHLGRMQDVLATFQSESVDAVVTDPPYELNFMGKGWDNSGVAFQKETWQHCYRVLKPGGYLLAFGGTRTFHRIACAIEDAGFEIRDTIMWLYGSGFPKSMNIGLAIDKKNGTDNRTGTILNGVGTNNTFSMKNGLGGGQEFATKYEERKATNKWAGWGTCLKPAYEPIIVARKPFKGSLVDNVLENGVGGLNIDECRVGDEIISIHNAPAGSFAGGEPDRGSDTESYRNSTGRFPANVILTYDETDEQEVCGGMPNTGTGNNGEPYNYAGKEYNNKSTSMFNGDRPLANSNYNDNGSASRYFYCAKASKRDRDAGLDAFEYLTVSDGRQTPIDNPFQRGETKRRNTHPTVKPVDLMQYLIRLVCPKGSVILDPFNGSGSTGKAVMYENSDRNANYYYIGIEMTEEYLPISKARIDYAIKDKEKVEFDSEPVEKDSDKNNKPKQHKIDLW